MLDQGAGHRAAPPAGRPAVQMLVADHNQVGLALAGELGYLMHRLAHQQFALRLKAGLGHALEAVIQNALEALLVVLHISHAIVHHG